MGQDQFKKTGDVSLDNAVLKKRLEGKLKELEQEN
jgi:hypothetical protein